MKPPEYKRYESKYHDPRNRRLEQVVENEIVFTFLGKPTEVKKIAKVVNNDNLYKKKVSVEEIEKLVGLRSNNLYWSGGKLGTVSSRMPDNDKR